MVDQEVEKASPFKEPPSATTKADPKPRPVDAVKEAVFGKKTPVGRPQKAKATTTTTRKVDMTDGIALTYGTFGTILAYRSPELVPVGTTMQIMAPYAGKQLNKAIKRSDIAYRFLSPIFSKGQTASEIGSAILPPILVYVMTKNPAAGVTLMPMLRMMMRPALVEMAKAMAKEKETLAQFAGEGPDGEVEGELDELMAVIFGSMVAPEGEGEPPSEPSGATAQSPFFAQVTDVG